jgi:hypothetical protein
VHAGPTRTRRVTMLAALPLLLAVACTSSPGQSPVDHPDGKASQAVGAPSPAAVCDHLPPGPDSPPQGAVRVDPAVEGDLAAKTKASQPGTVFWLAGGRHTLSRQQYDQVLPQDGDTFIGAPGAVLDGQHLNQYAFGGSARNVTIRFLTVQNFIAPLNEGVVNHDSGNGWVIEHSAIEHNGGAALMAGANQQMRANCLRANGQYALNAYQAADGITGLLLEGNEIVGNNTDDWEAREPSCGCSGGAKFWSVDGADVRGNWVHDNRGPGLWADTNNNDFLVESNLIENNDGAAIIYETSYNAVIRNNTVRRNNWVEGRTFADRSDSFPAATIYVSESGGEPRVHARTDKIEITGNVLEDNWSGVTLWENADRFCNSPANTSSKICTLMVSDQASCARPGISTAPLYGDCRWRTQRVEIHHNRFALDPAVIRCESTCTRMAVLSNFGTYPDWSPYHGDVIQESITHGQGNSWHDNTYVGPWTFMPHDMGRVLDQVQWQVQPYGQDEGSTFARRAGG